MHRVGLFGHYGLQNLGDEAIIEALIQNLARRWPHARLCGFSMNPADTARRYGIPAFPVRRVDGQPSPSAGVHGDLAADVPEGSGPRVGRLRDALKSIPPLRATVKAVRRAVTFPRAAWRELLFLKQSYRALKELDILVVAGSNQFLDNFGGPWAYPYTLLKWSVLARLAGVRVVYVSVGAGPIDSVWSRVMVRAALLLSDYVSFRDAASLALITWAGFRRPALVYPDLAHSLTLEPDPQASPGDSGRPPVVGVNPMPLYDRRYWYITDHGRYERYVARLAAFTSRLIRKGYPVFLFGTQARDELVIDDVLACLDEDVRDRVERDRLVRKSRTVPELMAVIRSADIVVATRFHGTVLALHAGRPVLGVCYYRKARDLLHEMGQEEYTLDADTFDLDTLWSRFQLLEVDRLRQAERIQRKDHEYRRFLNEQYDAVLRLLADKTPAPAFARPTGGR